MQKERDHTDTAQKLDMKIFYQLKSVTTKNLEKNVNFLRAFYFCCIPQNNTEV